MKAETHLQNQLRSNGNLERCVSVYLGEAVAAVCDTIIFICVPFFHNCSCLFPFPPLSLFSVGVVHVLQHLYGDT